MVSIHASAKLCHRAAVVLLLLGLFSIRDVRADESAEAEGQSPVKNLKLLSLEDLLAVQVDTVYGASKHEQKTTEAPSSVSIVTRDEIRRYGYRTLAEILQSLQGFHVSYDRNYAFLGARGVSLGDFNSRVLLLIDGHRVNNNLTDGAHLGTEFLLDVDLIDRVEIIRGPGSVLYGNNAFFAVIDVITRKAAQVENAEVSGEYGEFGTYKGRVTVAKAFTNGLSLLASGSYYESEGAPRIFYKEFNNAAHNHGVAQDMDADLFKSFFGSLGYRDLTLEGGFIRREKVNPTAAQFTTFNDPRLRTVDDRRYADLKYAHSFPEVLDVTARVYYDRNDYRIGYPVGDPMASAFYQEVQGGEWWGAELQLSKRLWEKHLITVGAEYRDDFRQDKRVFDQHNTYTDIYANRQSHGLFVQGDFTLRTNLHLNGGVRYDKYGDFDAAFNPRLALIYHPFQPSTFKVLYGTAFRSPNFLELSDRRFQNIKPERITSYELVYEQGLGQHLRSSLSGFYNQMDDLIVFSGGNFANVNAETRGMELALEGNWSGGLRSRASYTLQQTENQSSSQAFPDSPTHLFKFNLSVPLVKEKLFASLEYQFTSSRDTEFTSGAGVGVPGVDAAGFGVVNFTLFSQNLVKNLELSASVYNLLDQAYSDPATRFHVQDQLPRDGRTFRLKLTYRF